MDQNWFSALGTVSSGDHSLRDSINRDRLNGLATALIGLCLFPMAFVLSDSTEFDIPQVVIIIGSIALIDIGSNAFLDMNAFEYEWDDREWISWFPNHTEMYIRCWSGRCYPLDCT